MSGYYQVVYPPDIEWLAQAFLTPILAPALVGTRVPKAQSAEDVAAGLSGYLRIESGDATPVASTFGAAYDVPFLMHAYCDDENQAAKISRTAIANVAAVTGQMVLDWQIVCVPSVIGGRRLTEPGIPTNLVRYRSAVTWRVAGHLTIP